MRTWPRSDRPPQYENLIELFSCLLCDIGSSHSSCVGIGPKIHLLRLTFKNRSLRVQK